MTWLRLPSSITTIAVMTLTMLPMGRSVSRFSLHKIWSVAALTRAPPAILMPEGPGVWVGV